MKGDNLHIPVLADDTTETAAVRDQEVSSTEPNSRKESPLPTMTL